MAGLTNSELQAVGFTGTAVFEGDFPSFGPRHVSSWLQHVAPILTRNWHKCYCVFVAVNFNVGSDFLNAFLVGLLAVRQLSGIHFINNHSLFHT